MKDNFITFKQLELNDLTILHQWFQIPHVLTWYARGKPFTYDEIEKKYLPRINDVTIPSYIIYIQEKPVGYIQLYQVEYHFPEGIENNLHSIFNDFKAKELAGIDLFIADKDLLHTGFSTNMLNKFIETYIKEKFHAIVVDPVVSNTVAIKFFEKNGFKHIISQNKQYDLMIKNIVDKI